MRVLGLIPARSGSKGVPGKNTKLLNGIPLIGYTISSALKSELITKVVVSTDDENIARISKELGADVPFLRPKHLADDKSPTIDTVIHAVNYFKNIGENYDAICLLQATVPFRTVEDIDKSILKFKELDVDCLFSVSEIPHKYNPHWAFLVDENSGYLNIATGENEIITRRQDLPKAYFRDGAIYITKTPTILKKNSLYGERISYFKTSNSASINIDTMEDWSIAEAFISRHED